MEAEQAEGRDVFSLGGEVEVRTRARRTNLGFRVGLAAGPNPASNFGSDGVWMTLGPRVHIASAVFGLDFVQVRPPGEDISGHDAYGWRLSAAVAGRPGKYIVGAAAVGTTVLGLLLVAALSQSDF